MTGKKKAKKTDSNKKAKHEGKKKKKNTENNKKKEKVLSLRDFGKKEKKKAKIEIKKLEDITLNTIAEYKSLYPKWDKAKVAEKLKKTSEGSDLRYVALKKGKIIGQIKVVFGFGPHEHRAEISPARVLPKEEKNIEMTLAKHAIKKMPKKIKLILLAMDRKNKKAISIYKKLGFKKYGLLKRASKIRGRYVDNLLMEKESK